MIRHKDSKSGRLLPVFCEQDILKVIPESGATMKQICAGVGCKRSETAKKFLDQLEQSGKIRKEVIKTQGGLGYIYIQDDHERVTTPAGVAQTS